MTKDRIAYASQKKDCMTNNYDNRFDALLDIEECVRFYPPDIRPLDDNDAIFQNQIESQSIALYIHIPFCKSPCGFCPFNQYHYSDEQYTKYCDSIEKEILLLKRKIDFSQKRISSLWIGGGTPTDLTDEQLDCLLSVIQRSFDLEHISEFTIEGKPVPGMITGLKLKLLKRHGVTRISLGVQSTISKYLKILGRNYTFDDALSTLDLIHSYDMGINVDMIYRIPNESEDDIVKDVEKISSYDIDHISLFHYIWHNGTPLTRKYEGEHVVKNYDRDEFFRHYQMANRILADHGYRQYTPYYYTKDKMCQYHVDRWKMPQTDVLGVGAGAFSAFNNWIYANAHNLNLYCSRLNEGSLPITMGKRMSQDDVVSRLAVLGCKFFSVDDGCFEKIAKRGIREYFGEKIFALEALGLIYMDETGLHCTTKGKAFNNTVAMILASDEYHMVNQPQPLEIREEGL